MNLGRFIAWNGRFAAAAARRRRADLACRVGVGGSSCPRLLREGSGARCATPRGTVSPQAADWTAAVVLGTIC
jgi:hypothetical protein